MIDTHCHLIDPQFKHDLEKVIIRAQSSGIRHIINIGYDVETSISAVEMNEKYDWVLPAVGIHPNEFAEESLSQMAFIEHLCQKKKVVAVGETGLDYHRNYTPKDAQQELFRRHIELAKKYNLPLIIHTRNSIDDTIKILKEEDYHQGVFHCFSGTIQQAKEVIELGFYLGFGGVLTFSKNMRENFLHLPLESIVLETDAPFLAPSDHRGKRNEPAFIIEILHFAASIRGLPIKKIDEITDRNAISLFNIKV